MYMLVVYFTNNIEFIYCDTYNEAQKELENIVASNSIERYEIKCR